MSPTAPPSTPRRIQPDETLGDHALLLRLGRGDPEAGRAFVHRYQRRVYGLARSVMGDPTRAEEIAQEALIRAWRNAGSYDARLGTVSNWLLTITRNMAIDALRRKSAQPTDPSAALFLEAPARCAEPVDTAIVADDTDRVRAAMGLLPNEQRRALLLAAFYGLSAREISETESIPLGTAKSRIRLSLRKVRSLLSEDESPTDPKSHSRQADRRRLSYSTRQRKELPVIVATELSPELLERVPRHPGPEGHPEGIQ